MRLRELFIVFGIALCACFWLAVHLEFITFANQCPPGNCDEYYDDPDPVYPVPDPISVPSEPDVP